MVPFGRLISRLRNPTRAARSLINLLPGRNISLNGENLSHTIYSSNKSTVISVDDLEGNEIAKYEVSFLDGGFKVVVPNKKFGKVFGKLLPTKTIAQDHYFDNNITITREGKKLHIEMKPALSEKRPKERIQLSDNSKVWVKYLNSKFLLKRSGNNYEVLYHNPKIRAAEFFRFFVGDGGVMTLSGMLEIERDGNKIHLELIQEGEEQEVVKLTSEELEEGKVEIDTQHGQEVAAHEARELTAQEISTLQMPVVPEEVERETAAPPTAQEMESLRSEHSVRPFEFLDLSAKYQINVPHINEHGGYVDRGHDGTAPLTNSELEYNPEYLSQELEEQGTVVFFNPDLADNTPGINPLAITQYNQTSVWDPAFWANQDTTMTPAVTEVIDRREGENNSNSWEENRDREHIYNLLEELWLEASDSLKGEIIGYVEKAYEIKLSEAGFNPRTLLKHLPIIEAEVNESIMFNYFGKELLDDLIEFMANLKALDMDLKELKGRDEVTQVSWQPEEVLNAPLYL